MAELTTAKLKKYEYAFDVLDFDGNAFLNTKE